MSISGAKPPLALHSCLHPLQMYKHLRKVPGWPCLAHNHGSNKHTLLSLYITLPHAVTER